MAAATAVYPSLLTPEAPLKHVHVCLGAQACGRGGGWGAGGHWHALWNKAMVLGETGGTMGWLALGWHLEFPVKLLRVPAEPACGQEEKEGRGAGWLLPGPGVAGPLPHAPRAPPAPSHQQMQVEKEGTPRGTRKAPRSLSHSPLSVHKNAAAALAPPCPGPLPRPTCSSGRPSSVCALSMGLCPPGRSAGDFREAAPSRVDRQALPCAEAGHETALGSLPFVLTVLTLCQTLPSLQLRAGTMTTPLYR